MNQEITTEVLDDLVQIVTHRISSLTAGVEGYADLLTETLNAPEQRRLARHILEGVARINGVVDDLRFFVQPLAPVAVQMPIWRLIDSVVDILLDTEREQLELPARRRRLRVLADPHLSRQALLALVRNALDAVMPGGKIRLKVASDDAGSASIRIWNDGPGLTDSEATRALAPFYTTKAQNLGLGLTIAHRMAEAQGGSVAFEHVTEGACVVLRLPLVVAQEA